MSVAISASIAAAAPDPKDIAELRGAPDDDPNDLEALDAAWEEQAITFGPGEEGCPKAQQMLREMNGVDDMTADAHARN